ncbi:hypothetical protein ACIG56_00910 [Nocardia fusca]|uniref:hypothetical protein n=1 Tax=Nocardia fusca TaxID=941183 RepID=UPI0037C6B749
MPSTTFHMRVVTTTPEQVVTIEPIDVMTCNDEGLITSTRRVLEPGRCRHHTSEVNCA